jgi:hypothetical protein
VKQPKNSLPAPLRSTFFLPAGRKIEFRFTAPDLLAYEITPPPVEFASHGDAMAFLRAYVDARRAFLLLVATATGLTISVADDLPDGSTAIGEPIAPLREQC